MKKPIRQIRVEGNVAYVPLTQGYEAIIDAENVALVDRWNWYALASKRSDKSVRAVYAVRFERIAERKKLVRMHRVILKTPETLDTDHVDGDGLNNRRANLRWVTVSQNMHNQRKSIASTSGVKGVGWHKATGKWQARIRIENKTRSLGYFSDINDAAAAYREASNKFHGAFGRIS